MEEEAEALPEDAGKLRERLEETQQALKQTELQRSQSYSEEAEALPEDAGKLRERLEETQQALKRTERQLQRSQSYSEEAEALPEDAGKLRERLEETQQALKRTERQLQRSQSYSEELRQQIETLSAELHQYRTAAQHRHDAECQVEESAIAEAFGDKPMPDWGVPGGCAETMQNGEGVVGVSIADSLKAAAEEVVWQEAGFVYDNTTGLYYDHNSGYYYDSARSLYYDPGTTSYSYYDEAEQTYKFHSYAGGQGTQDWSQSGTQGAAAEDPSQKSAATPSASATPSATTATAAGSEVKEKTGTKRHKDRSREKEKAKNHKDMKKARRRSKSKHKSKKRGRKHRSKDKEKDEDKKKEKEKQKEKKEKRKEKKNKKREKDMENSDMASTNSNEEGNKEKKRKTDKTNSIERMEEETSDSLATGESEMISEPESGELTDQTTEEDKGEEEDKDNDEERDDDGGKQQTIVELTGLPVEYDASAVIASEPEVCASYPPCVRGVVQASDVLEPGTFFMVPCTGGSIGRDKDPRHALQIKDLNVSKMHAEIQYDSGNSCYTVEDLGSQNGTFINDLRISLCKERSGAVPLTHGDILTVAATSMLLHIHPGSETCDLCEPGQVLAALRAQQTVFNEHVVLTKKEKQKQAREQMKNIKKKYGLANAAYVDNPAAFNNPDYADKADLRRRFVGSEHHSHAQRQQPPASVHRAITAENKGHRMLAKMGWKEGSGLGKHNAGRAEPVTVELRASQTAGLGSASSLGVSLDNVQSADKTKRLLQTQARYQRLEKSQTTGRDAASAGDGGDTGYKITDTGSAGGQAGKKIQINWIRGGTQKPP